MESTKIKTDFMLPKTPVLFGMGTVIDLMGTGIHFSLPKRIVNDDSKAIASDWAMVGKDIRFAINEYRRSSKNAKQ